MLSHGCAGGLLGLRPASRGLVDITSVVHMGRRLPGVTRHCGRLHPEDRTLRDGIPVTSVPRTLLDLAEVLQPPQLARAIEAAERQRVFDLAAVHRLLDRSRGRRGVKPLATLLSDYAEPVLTRSDIEAILFALCRDGGLPLPAMNTVVEGEEVDALFAAQRVVVEVDSRGFHMTTAAFERDRRRDAKLMLAGVPGAEDHLPAADDDPDTVLETLRRLLEPG